MSKSIDFCVVLVGPEHPHNIGFCARAMRSNGLTDLRVVRDKPLPKAAWETAHASAEILDNAIVVDDMQQALADCGSVIGFSRRVFGTVSPHISLPELPSHTLLQREKVALVFGRESKGLSAEEMELCSIQCEIPVAGDMSLNLAQAVSVALYELCRANLLSDRPALAKRNRVRDSRFALGAGVKEWESMVQYLAQKLDGQNGRNQPWSETAIRKWLHRLAPDALELRALFGIIRTLTGEKARSEKGKVISRSEHTDRS